MNNIKLKLLNWLVKSMNIKFVGFKLSPKDELDVIGNIPIEDFEKVLALVKQIEKGRNGNEDIN